MQFVSRADHHVLISPEGWEFTKAVANSLVLRVTGGNQIKQLLGLTGKVQDTSKILYFTSGMPMREEMQAPTKDVLKISFSPVIERLTEKQRDQALKKFQDDAKAKGINPVIPRYTLWDQIGKIEADSFSICIQSSPSIMFEETKPGYYVSITVYDPVDTARFKHLFCKKEKILYLKEHVDHDPYQVAEDVYDELFRLTMKVKCGEVPEGSVVSAPALVKKDKQKRAKTAAPVVEKDEIMDDAEEMLASADSVLAFSELAASSSEGCAGPSPEEREAMRIESKNAKRAARKKK